MENDVLNKGKLTCDKKILCSIISLATREINGVSALKSPVKNKLISFLSKEVGEGVKIKFNENGSLLVDVYITVLHNVSVPDVAFKVQENIKNNISSMVDMRTSKVNVHVVGVDFIDPLNNPEKDSIWEENQEKVPSR